jgi:hypothetical protein
LPWRGVSRLHTAANQEVQQLKLALLQRPVLNTQLGETKMSDDECCSDKDLLSKTGCILTYGGSLYHSIINYALVVLSIGPAIYYPTTRRRPAIAALLFTSTFQISLCLFVVDCAGVSIIWCATCGWLYTGHHRYHHRPMPLAVRATLWLGAGGILYYMATLPPITTVAHFCAVGMGSMLHWFAQPPQQQQQQQQPRRSSDETAELNDKGDSGSNNLSNCETTSEEVRRNPSSEGIVL